MLVAGEDGDWLGMAVAFVHPDKDGTVSLWWRWVAPTARGRGLARRRVEARADKGAETGAVRLEAAVAEKNKAAKELYRTSGSSRQGNAGRWPQTRPVWGYSWPGRSETPRCS